MMNYRVHFLIAVTRPTVGCFIGIKGSSANVLLVCIIGEANKPHCMTWVTEKLTNQGDRVVLP